MVWLPQNYKDGTSSKIIPKNQQLQIEHKPKLSSELHDGTNNVPVVSLEGLDSLAS